jgi:hypothetical protein
LTGIARRVATVAAIAASLVVAGCGEDGETTTEPGGVGQVKVGSVASLAQCRDWVAGTDAEKLSTIEDIREQINLEDAPVEVPELSDEQAFALFERTCRRDFAAGFRLYVVYARAAAFRGLATP